MPISLFASTFAAALIAAAQPVGGAPTERMFQMLPVPACATPLGTTGKAVAIPERLNETLGAGVMAGLFLTVQDPAGSEWKDSDLDAAAACPLAKFAADEAVWTIYSGTGTAPQRLVLSPGRPELFALLRGPTYAEAARWSRSRQDPPPAGARSAYHLVGYVADGTQFLIRSYDGPPPLTALAADIGALTEGGAPPLAMHDPDGAAVSLFLPVAAGPQAEVFRPGDLAGERYATLHMPDGRFVTEGRNGDYVLRGSGFACHREYGALKRARITLANASDAGLELSCGLESDQSTMTVIVTRRPDASRDGATFAALIETSETETGVARQLEAPPTGPKQPLQAGAHWVDKDGSSQLALFSRRGEYVYQIRLTYPAEDRDPAWAALGEMIAQVTGHDPRPPPAREERIPDSWRR